MARTMYEYLLEKQETGEMKILFRLGVTTSIPMYMDIYRFHLSHPLMSLFNVSLAMNVGKTTVQRAYKFMEQEA